MLEPQQRARERGERGGLRDVELEEALAAGGRRGLVRASGERDLEKEEGAARAGGEKERVEEVRNGEGSRGAAAAARQRERMVSHGQFLSRSAPDARRFSEHSG